MTNYSTYVIGEERFINILNFQMKNMKLQKRYEKYSKVMVYVYWMPLKQV